MHMYVYMHTHMRTHVDMHICMYNKHIRCGAVREPFAVVDTL